MSFAQSKGPGRVALVLDSLSTHMAVDIQRQIRDLGVDLFFIPGGLTGYIQPVDVGIVSPFNNWLREGWSAQFDNLYGRPIQKRRNVCRLVKESWARLSHERISSSFSKFLSCCPEEQLDLEQIDLLECGSEN